MQGSAFTCRQGVRSHTRRRQMVADGWAIPHGHCPGNADQFLTQSWPSRSGAPARFLPNGGGPFLDRKENVVISKTSAHLPALSTRRRVRGITATTVLALALSAVGPTAGADPRTTLEPVPVPVVPVVEGDGSSGPVKLDVAHIVGQVVGTEGDAEIREVHDGAGNVVGYTFDDASRVLHEATTVGSLIAEQPGQHTTTANFGLRTTVRVLTGAHKLSSRTAQQEYKELALALTGVGGLQAGCNFRVL